MLRADMMSEASLPPSRATYTRSETSHNVRQSYISTRTVGEESGLDAAAQSSRT